MSFLFYRHNMYVDAVVGGRKPHVEYFHENFEGVDTRQLVSEIIKW